MYNNFHSTYWSSSVSILSSQPWSQSFTSLMVDLPQSIKIIPLLNQVPSWNKSLKGICLSNEKNNSNANNSESNQYQCLEQLYLPTSTKYSIKASTAQVQNFLFIPCQRFAIKDVNDFVSYLFCHHLPKKKMIFSFSSSSCLVNFAGGPYKMSTLFRRAYYSI